MTNAQSIEKHEWKERVLLIMEKESESSNTEKQIDLLLDNANGLKERQLVTYVISEKQAQKLDRANGKLVKTTNSDHLFYRYNKGNADFKVILIGLDGTVKNKYLEPVSTKKLFTIIDGMPMRKAEIKKGN
ncbi:DUF4174 domain-containing protein [Nonlabens ponticola]|nr:DUF4174 domain-containing protein [Nonlabens ponticola]